MEGVLDSQQLQQQQRKKTIESVAKWNTRTHKHTQICQTVLMNTTSKGLNTNDETKQKINQLIALIKI